MRTIRRNSTALALALGAGLILTANASAQKVGTERVISGLSAPTYLTHAGDGSGRIFVTEQNSGQIKVYNGTTYASLGTFLNVGAISSSGGERGLLGLAFHPDYATNGRFFINYTNNSGNTVIAEYLASPPSSNTANATATQTIMTISQPFSNHNGGWIDFSPVDGYLYIGTGDGGSGGDPGNRSQDITNQLLGKMLRVDVDADDFPADSTRNYAIPADNPFVGVSGDDEIWDYGLRNPWRNGFDQLNGDLYIADVGQNAWEEVNVRPVGDAGGINWGWRLKEGNACFNPPSNCDPGGITTDPVHVYSLGGSPFRCAITGGEVYRGTDIDGLQGTYFFADFCSDQIWSFRMDGGLVTQFEDRTADMQPPVGVLASISSFGRDEQGEVYAVNLNGGVFKIVSDQMKLTVPQMTGGSQTTWTVNNASPNKKVFYAASTDGFGLTPVDKLNGTIFLTNPFLVGTDISTAAGDSSLTFTVPNNASGATVYLQAAEKGNTSDAHTQTIL